MANNLAAKFCDERYGQLVSGTQSGDDLSLVAIRVLSDGEGASDDGADVRLISRLFWTDDHSRKQNLASS